MRYTNGKIRAPEFKAFSGPVQVYMRNKFKSEVRTWKEGRAVSEGWRKSAILHACTSLRSQALASVPLVAGKIDEEGKVKKLDRSHELQKLLENPSQNLSMSQINQLLVLSRDIGGNFFILKLGSENKAKELQPLISDSVSVVMNDPDNNEYIKLKNYLTKNGDKLGKINGHVAGYKYDLSFSGGEIQYFKHSDIIHFRNMDPSNHYCGMSPLEAAASIVDMEVTSVKWNLHMFENGFSPDAIINPKQSLSQDQSEKFTKSLQNQTLGPTNSHVPFVVGTPVDVILTSKTPKEVDWIESRKLNWQEICSVYGTPMPMIQIYFDATLANVDSAEAFFWLDTMIPYGRLTESTWTKELAKDFGEDFVIYYDFSKVDAVQRNMNKKMESVKPLFSQGVPMSQLNERFGLGLSPYDGWDVSYLPANLVPVLADGLF